MSNEPNSAAPEAYIIELLQEGGVEIPPPGGERSWSLLNNAHKVAGVTDLPFRQRQFEFLRRIGYKSIPECNDLIADVIDVISASKNEHYRTIQMPAGVNCLSDKRSLRPPLRYYRFNNVDVIFGERSFSVANVDGAFDPVSSRIPSLDERQAPTIGMLHNAVITMDRFGASNISHHLFDTIGRYLGFNSSAFAASNGLKDSSVLLLPAVLGEYQNYVLRKLSVPHVKLQPGMKVHVDRLFVCDQVTVDFNEGYSHPAMFGEKSIVETMRRKLIDAGIDFGQNVYVSRQDTNRRPIVNEAEVENYLSSKGFRILVPSTLSPELQLSALAGANVVVGPHGAGLTNIVACSSGTIVHELIHPLKGTDAYAIMSKALGFSYSSSSLIDHGGGFKGAVDLEQLDSWLVGVS